MQIREWHDRGSNSKSWRALKAQFVSICLLCHLSTGHHAQADVTSLLQSLPECRLLYLMHLALAKDEKRMLLLQADGEGRRIVSKCIGKTRICECFLADSDKMHKLPELLWSASIEQDRRAWVDNLSIQGVPLMHAQSESWSCKYVGAYIIALWIN